jgi:signal transduction histidine kinase
VFQKEFEKTFGIFLQQGSSILDALPNDIKPLWKERYDKVLKNERLKFEDHIDTSTGTIYIQVSMNPILKNGKVIGGSCFGSDISHRKKTEIELINAKEQAEISDRLKSAFLANMSHEIRTPMNGILGFTKLLDTDNLSDEKRKKYILFIKKNTTRLLNQINDILDISKIEAGQVNIFLREFNINEQIENVYNFMLPEAESKGLILKSQKGIEDSKAFISCDREKFYAILLNLVKNAIKFTNTGSIEFGYYIIRETLFFYVHDTGVGIEESHKKNIFERFSQTDTGYKQSKQGTGLGLAISKAYVEMLGGRIWVENRSGEGSSFFFTLPYLQ